MNFMYVILQFKKKRRGGKGGRRQCSESNASTEMAIKVSGTA